MLINQAAQAAMFGGSTAERITLFGTSSVPTLRTAFGDGNTARTYLYFVVPTVTSAPNNINRGVLGWDSYEEGVQASYTDIHNWVTPTDFQDGPYYVKALSEADDAPNEGSNLGQWYALNNPGSNIFWGWSATGLFGSAAGTISIHIADAQPEDSNVVAVGYYRGVLTREI